MRDCLFEVLLVQPLNTNKISWEIQIKSRSAYFNPLFAHNLWDVLCEAKARSPLLPSSHLIFYPAAAITGSPPLLLILSRHQLGLNRRGKMTRHSPRLSKLESRDRNSYFHIKGPGNLCPLKYFDPTVVQCLRTMISLVKGNKCSQVLKFRNLAIVF